MKNTGLAALFGFALLCAGCGHFVARELRGEPTPAPSDFTFLGTKSPCYLELAEGEKALRVNCFELDGVLHIHSSRWTGLPRFSGESWIFTIQREPNVRVEIEDAIFSMRARLIDDEALRVQILKDRGYWIAWEGIQVFRFEPTKSYVDD